MLANLPTRGLSLSPETEERQKGQQDESQVSIS